MASYAAEHNARKVGLGETRENALTGGGRTRGVENFLQGGGAGNSIIWVRDVGPFGVNDEEGRRYTHGVPATDTGEASEAIRIQDMGDAGDRSRIRGSGNAVSKNQHI